MWKQLKLGTKVIAITVVTVVIILGGLSLLIIQKSTETLTGQINKTLITSVFRYTNTAESTIKSFFCFSYWYTKDF